jgi:hypothetical protein
MDAVIHEIRRIKEANAAKHGHNLQAILEDLCKRQCDDGRKVLTFDPRRPDAVIPSLRPEPSADGGRP